jgi:hypothetical protein
VGKKPYEGGSLMAEQRDYLELLSRWFTEMNREYFEFKLRPAAIRFSSPRSSKEYGEYRDGEAIIRASLITGRHPQAQSGPEHERGRLLLIRDVLLHLMVHQCCAERLNRPEEHYDGHGPIFRDKCNEIGQKLGLPEVRSSKCHKKVRHLVSCGVWPWALRPDGYHQGAFTPVVPRRRKSAVPGLVERILALDLEDRRELTMILMSKKLI